MKKLIAIAVVLLLASSLLASSAMANKPETFVRRGPVAQVEFNSTGRVATTHTKCPGNSSLVSGYTTIVQDPSPYGVRIVAEDTTNDQQGWEATALSLGLYSPGEDIVATKFQVAVICLR